MQLYIIEDGEIEMVKDVGDSNDGVPQQQQRVCKVSSGSVFGEAEFFLKKPHRYSPLCFGFRYFRLQLIALFACSVCAFADRETVLWTLSSRNYAKMEAEQPHLCILFQHILLKNFSLHQIVLDTKET
jgi:CRP-like cAMP-binding protein